MNSQGDAHVLKQIGVRYRSLIAVVATTTLTIAMTGTGAVASSPTSTTSVGCSTPSSGRSTSAGPSLIQVERLFRVADISLAVAAVSRTEAQSLCAYQAKVMTALRRMPGARSFDALNADFVAAINALAQWYTLVKGLLLTPAAPASGSSNNDPCLNSVCVPIHDIIGRTPDLSQLALVVEQLTEPVTDATRGILQTVGTVAHASFNLPAHVVALMPVDLPADIPTTFQSEPGPGPADNTQIMANATDNVGSAGTASLQRDKLTCDEFPLDYGSVDNFGRPGPHDTQGDIQNSTVHGYADGAAYLIHDYTESGDGATIGGNTDSQDADAQAGFGATFVGGTPSTNFLADIQITMPVYWAGDAHAGSNTPLGSGYVPYLGKIIGGFAGKSVSSVKVNINADVYNDSVMLTSYPIFDPPELIGDNGTGGNSMNYYGSFTYKALIPFSGTPHAFATVLHYHAHLTDSPSTATDVLADADFTNQDIIGQINASMIRWHFVLSPGVHGWVNCNA